MNFIISNFYRTLSYLCPGWIIYAIFFIYYDFIDVLARCTIVHCFYHVCMNVYDSRVFKDSFVSIKLLFIYLMVHLLRIRMCAFQLSLYTNWPESRSVSWDLWNGAFAGYKVCHWKVTKRFEGGVHVYHDCWWNDFCVVGLSSVGV